MAEKLKRHPIGSGYNGSWMFDWSRGPINVFMPQVHIYLTRDRTKAKIEVDFCLRKATRTICLWHVH